MTEPQAQTVYDTPEQIAENFARWRAAMEASHTMLMAGLRDRVGPDGDIEAAYREWNDDRRSRKMRAYERAAQRYAERQAEAKRNNGATDAS